MENIMETISDNLPKQKKASFFEDEKSNSMSSQFNRLFGRQKPVHHLLGGGKSADVLLWRDKKISASCLTGATIVWVIFEWLNYNFLTLLSLVIVIGIVAQFVWKSALGILNRSPSEVPRLVLPEHVFINIGKLVGGQVNRGLNFLQDVACGGNMKQFLVVVLSLWVVAIIGSWCNLLTVIYIGFVAANTLPVLYERYENEVDGSPTMSWINFSIIIESWIVMSSAESLQASSGERSSSGTWRSMHVENSTSISNEALLL